MRWFQTKELRNSIYALFNVNANASAGDEAAAMDRIQDRMLALALDGPREHARGLVRRIRYARDLQALWFLRGELMQFLARSHGEVAAHEKVDELSSHFAPLLPSSLRSRPSPLGPAHRIASRSAMHGIADAPSADPLRGSR